jgi:hypothetical protein
VGGVRPRAALRTTRPIRVVLGATPQLPASIIGGAEKAAILDVDVTGVTPAVDGRTITVAGAAVRLTQGAADALNATLATSGFTAGLVLGRATVTATGRCTPEGVRRPPGRRTAI